MSVRHTPAPAIRTTTSVGAEMVGVGRSSRVRGELGKTALAERITIARMNAMLVTPFECYKVSVMCTTGVLRFADGSHALMKNKDFGRSHLDDQIVLDQTVFGVRGMTTWAGTDPALDQFSGFSIGANRHGLLCCDSNVVTLDGLENYDVMTEVALRQGRDVSSAVEAVVSACQQRETSWGNLVLIDAVRAVSLEIRGRAVQVVELSAATARTNHHVILGFDPSQEDQVTSELRLESAQLRLASASSLDDIFALQKSHDHGATGVCNHALHTTVYAYVLICKGNEVVLHVKQGQPCQSDAYHAISVPLGDHFSGSAASVFLDKYPTANKTNFANPAWHSVDDAQSASGSVSAT